MSTTQTYFLAHTARGKLSSEAARPDHNLRLLVGHANLLDSLMFDLAEAEQEQESWFSASVQNASKPKTIQWADSIVEDPEEDWQAADADSDSSSDSESEFDEDEDMDMAPITRTQSHKQFEDVQEVEEEYEDDGEEDYASLSLSRVPSRSSSPPQLLHDSDDESSEDEAMPPSPPSTTLPSFSEKQREQLVTTAFYDQSQSKLSSDQQATFFNEGFYLPEREALASTVSVY